MERTIFYWSEPVRFGDAEYALTVATSWEGLCWCNLAELQERETEFREWTGRHFPNIRLTRSRGENAAVLEQIHEYFRGERRKFTLSLHQAGTPFQKRVWEELTRIPYGMTASYQDIAVRAGCPKGARAVGLANNKNPIAIVVPCHRVIGKNGGLTGYAGGLTLKQKLLELESA